MQKNKQKETSFVLNSIINASILVVIGIFLSKGLTYLYRIIVARSFGPEVYGLLTLAITIFSIFSVLANFGISDGISRFIPLYRGKKSNAQLNYLLNYSQKFIFIFSTFLGIVLFFSAEYISINIFHNPSLEIFLQILAISLPLSLLSELILMAIKAYELIGSFSFISYFINALSKIVLLFALMIFGLGSIAVPISYTLSTTVVFLSAYFVFSKDIIKKLKNSPQLKNHEKITVRNNLLNYSWPLILFSFSMVLLNWTDSLMIAYLKNATDVGFYNAALPIALLLTIPADIFMQMFFPVITREYATGEKKIVSDVSKQVTKWILMLSLPALISLIVFPEFFINLLFGEEYLVASNSLRFLAIGAFSTGVFAPALKILSMLGKSKLIMVNILISVILNVILNSLFIPKYGIDGAALATMISLFILNLTFFFQARKYSGILLLKRKMINISLVGFLIFLIFNYTKSFLLLSQLATFFIIVALFLSYLLMIILAKSFDENDLETIISFNVKIRKIFL